MGLYWSYPKPWNVALWLFSAQLTFLTLSSFPLDLNQITVLANLWALRILWRYLVWLLVDLRLFCLWRCWVWGLISIWWSCHALKTRCKLIHWRLSTKLSPWCHTYLLGLVNQPRCPRWALTLSLTRHIRHILMSLAWILVQIRNGLSNNWT